MDEIMFKFLEYLFWFMAISSPVGIIGILVGMRFCDKVDLVVVSCDRERHEYQSEDRRGRYQTGYYSTYSVTYSYEHNGEKSFATLPRRKEEAIGSKQQGYVNRRKPNKVADKSNLKLCLTMFAASGICSVPALIFMKLFEAYVFG
jgi:hypothetical protein